jgi:hypothetical protein
LMAPGRLVFWLTRLQPITRARGIQDTDRALRTRDCPPPPAPGIPHHLGASPAAYRGVGWRTSLGGSCPVPRQA